MTDPSVLLTRLRQTAPLVQCITNYVAMKIAANELLATGASPAMVHAEEEAGAFAAIAGALTINIGMLSPAWVAGMKAAIGGASAGGKPWVLDPVACFATYLTGNGETGGRDGVHRRSTMLLPRRPATGLHLRRGRPGRL